MALLPDADAPPELDPMDSVPSMPLGGVWHLHKGIEIQRARLFDGGANRLYAKPRVQIPGLHLTPPIVLRAQRHGMPPEDRTSRDLLADPRVTATIPGGQIYADADRVVWQTTAPGAEGVLADFMLALESARNEPWQALASKHRLNIDERGLSIFGTTGGLLARREHFDIRIREERRHTRIRIGLNGKLPADFKIGTGKPSPDQKLRDPILDRQLICDGMTPALRRAVLDVRDPLLHVLAERGESNITRDRIRVVVPGRLLADLDNLVDDALAVARALSASA